MVFLRESWDLIPAPSRCSCWSSTYAHTAITHDIQMREKTPSLCRGERDFNDTPVWRLLMISVTSKPPLQRFPLPTQNTSGCQEHRGGKSSGASESSVPAENHNEPFHSVLPEKHQQPSSSKAPSFTRWVKSYSMVLCFHLRH